VSRRSRAESCYVATSATNSVAPTVIIETKGYHPQAFSSACIISIVAADQEVQR
jgi:hypothetical protein